MTITIALAEFFVVAAAAIMPVMPMVVLFLQWQKHFVKGLASGSIKG